MDIQDIKELIACMENTGVREVKLKYPGYKLLLTSSASFVRKKDHSHTSDAIPLKETTATKVTAPCVGEFLDIHPLRTVPFLKSVAYVDQGHIIGLLRVGDLYLPVRAPVGGILGPALVAPGEKVGYDTALFDIYASD